MPQKYGTQDGVRFSFHALFKKQETLTSIQRVTFRMPSFTSAFTQLFLSSLSDLVHACHENHRDALHFILHPPLWVQQPKLAEHFDLHQIVLQVSCSFWLAYIKKTEMSEVGDFE